ncbi:hypothetical protein ACQEU3_43415 [Spirillospora sp. CA-253888]
MDGAVFGVGSITPALEPKDVPRAQGIAPVRRAGRPPEHDLHAVTDVISYADRTWPIRPTELLHDLVRRQEHRPESSAYNIDSRAPVPEVDRSTDASNAHIATLAIDLKTIRRDPAPKGTRLEPKSQGQLISVQPISTVLGLSPLLI